MQVSHFSNIFFLLFVDFIRKYLPACLQNEKSEELLLFALELMQQNY